MIGAFRRTTMVLLALLTLAAGVASAQSQAANGTIEGTIKDASGALLPGVTVTVHNTDTGAERVVVTDANGLYRAPLLPLGKYRVTAELAGFKKYEQTDIPITAGSAAVINMAMDVGGVTEVVSVVVGCRGRRSRKDRCRPQPERARNPQPPAGLAQPLQFCAPPAWRQRPGELGVRRAALQRQRFAAAHQLPDGRQHQHAEGSRRPPPDADVGGRDRRGQGHDQRLRAGVRADDGAGLQRDHAVGHQQAAWGRELSFPPHAVLPPIPSSPRFPPAIPRTSRRTSSTP